MFERIKRLEINFANTTCEAPFPKIISSVCTFYLMKTLKKKVAKLRFMAGYEPDFNLKILSEEMFRERN